MIDVRTCKFIAGSAVAGLLWLAARWVFAGWTGEGAVTASWVTWFFSTAAVLQFVAAVFSSIQDTFRRPSRPPADQSEASQPEPSRR